MKRVVKIFAGLLLFLMLASSCNRHIVCPAYANEQEKTEETKDQLPS